MSDNHDIMKELFEKIEEIEKDIKELKNYYTGKDSLDDWKYDEGTDEKALLNNIKHPEKETIGKIYYIQAYFNGSVIQNVPYMVIDTNHEYGAEGTVDLMSKVCAVNQKWNSSYNSWLYGKYTTSNIYNWLLVVCPNGYSSNIRSKMVTMTERWREAKGRDTGTTMSRQTDCKLLNPVELFGAYSSLATYDPEWTYANSSDHKTKFLTDNYGTLYPAWTNRIEANIIRCVFSDIAMTSATNYWTNSWLAFHSSYNLAFCFSVYTDGSCYRNDVDYTNAVAPVIRLSDKPDKPVGVKCNLL